MRVIGIILLLHFSSDYAFPQTCCSGGVPISGNIGFSSAMKGTWQFELSYDHNLLTKLYSGSALLDDNSRTRITNSVLLKFGYSISDKLAIDALLSYVSQKRIISQFNNSNTDETLGPGDAVIILKYIFLNADKSGMDLQIGLGPKIPTGAHAISSPSGITYNADLQPGSGSWDMISWLRMAKPLGFRPSVVFSANTTIRLNGKNKNYFEDQIYQFGNSLQIYTGISDRFALGKLLVEPSLALRFRMARQDKINNHEIDNTGGEWIYVSPSLGIIPIPNTLFFIMGEFPIYSKLNGTQLSNTYRIRAGVYYLLNRKNKINIKIDEL